jgi:hypothetical protein
MPDELVTGHAPSSPVEPKTPKPEDVPAQEAGTEGQEPEEAREEEAEPIKPRSGFAREKLKRAAAERRAEAAEARLREIEGRHYPPAEPLKRPKPEQFVDYDQYEASLDKYNSELTRRVVREEAATQRQVEAQIRAQEARREAVSEFSAECQDTAKDFPDAEEAARNLLNMMGGKGWNPDVLEALQAAKHGSVIHYWLTKNPTEAIALNNMDKVNAALMIGELSAKAELPQTRKVTGAPPPINAPKGGANAPKDPFQLAKKDDATDYIRMRMAEMKKDQS